MAWVIPLLLLAWPVVEIAVLVQVAQWIGWPGAILGIVLSGMIGGALLRRQGLTTAGRAQDLLRRGEMPVGELFDGACLAVAGILFFLPGFVTDLIAVALLVPPLRLLLRRRLGAVLVVRTAGAGPANPGRPGNPVIDGDFTVVPDDPAPPMLPGPKE